MPSYGQLVVLFAIGVAAVYLIAKLSREAVHSIFPGVVPGEPNTVLLASPRPNIGELSAKDLEGATEYDYVIVGTGTAGCVLANRLTEDGKSTVLAIEAGHSDLKQIFSRIPAAFGRLFGTSADWNFYTTMEPGCNDRKLFWPRGKMLGGSSAMNAMIYNKGAPADYDEWKKLGNVGWDSKEATKYHTKAEAFHQSERSDLTAEDLEHHGRKGPWQVGYSHANPLSKIFVDACTSVSIPKIRDFNGKSMLGGSLFQSFIDSRGQRSSTAVSYLTNEVAKRTNLKIATGQVVTRIILDTSSSKPRAIGVEMASSKASPIRYIVKAKKEVILSAGAIGSPQILKLSGVGPAEELKTNGIRVLKNLAGVGANLADHLCSIMCFESKQSSLQYLFHPTKSLPALIEWLRFGTGAMTSNAAEAASFLRVADREDAPASLKKKDLTSGPGSPDLELLIGPLSYIEHGRHVASMSKDWFSIGPILLRPESRGSVTLASSSPFDAPVIRANYLSTKHDQDMMTYGMRLCRDIAHAAAFKDVFSAWYHPSKDVATMTDAELLEAVRNTSETIYHPMCTNKMGPASDPTAVVDAKLKVHGVDCLRVVDASIFPVPVGCHPCAPVVMVAEKAADMIKADQAK